jgi:hypothetical protein
MSDALLKKHKLRVTDRGLLLMWGALLSQVAVPIGSAIYFLVTQVAYQTKYGNTTTTFIGLKDTWDRLPVHVQNLLHNKYLGHAHQAFGLHSQSAPLWWVTARHDARHVLIGFLGTLLVLGIMVGFKYVKKLKWHQMLGHLVLAFLASAAVAAVMIVLLSHGLAFAEHWGTKSGNPWVADWVNKGSWQLTIIGIAAGIPAHKILAPVFGTFQTMQAEKRLARKSPPPKWFPPNYRHRYDYLEDKYTDQQEAALRVANQSKVLKVVLFIAIPVLTFLLGFGIWLNYGGGPATHVLGH